MILYYITIYVAVYRMYLFQDGLVRMCTEEYVKPTKQVTITICRTPTITLMYLFPVLPSVHRTDSHIGRWSPILQNINMLFMHLTNYAVNKKNEKFQVSE